MKKLSSIKLIIALFIIITFYSCDKQDDDNIDTNPIILDCNYFELESRVLTDYPNKPVDYVITCNMNVYHKVTIEPGVVINFRDNSGLIIDESSLQLSAKGILNAIGTEEKPIVFTAENKVNGAWNGIIFYTDQNQNSLAFCEINYAGGNAFNSNNDLGSVIIYADSKVDIKDCNINFSGSNGINAVYSSATFSLKNTTITGSDEAPIVVTQSHIGEINGTNSYNNNTLDYVKVQIGTDAITKDTKIHKINVPYRIFAEYNGFQHILIEDGITTIDEDIVIEFSNGTGIYVDDYGTFVVNSSGDGVLFTGVSKSPGSWKGIYYQFTQENNLLQNLTIEYAGNEFDNSKDAIAMWGNPKLSISNISISHIDGCGIKDLSNVAVSPNPNFTKNAILFTDVTGGNYCYQ